MFSDGNHHPSITKNEICLENQFSGRTLFYFLFISHVNNIIILVIFFALNTRNIANISVTTKIISFLSKSYYPMLLQQVLFSSLAYQTVANNFCCDKKNYVVTILRNKSCCSSKECVFLIKVSSLRVHLALMPLSRNRKISIVTRTVSKIAFRIFASCVI